jgi:hypothetical protein
VAENTSVDPSAGVSSASKELSQETQQSAATAKNNFDFIITFILKIYLILT